MIRTNSILLNSPTQSPRLAPQQLPSSSSSCSSDTPRRIRFAPLPDEIDAPTPTPPQPSSPPQLPPPPPPPAAVESKPKSKSSSSIFRHIFRRSSLVSDAAPPRRFSAEDITSRILRRPRTPQHQELGSPLTRTSSCSSSTTQARHQERPSTAPSRSSINSLGSGGGRHTMPPNRFTPPSSPSVPTKSGMRMLNGRVYGSKRQPPANPFANVRDDPEFVEWGYGGMGSVTCSSDSKYSVLAKGTPALLSHAQPQGIKIPVGGGRGGAAVAVERNDGVGVPSADDDHDGTGMGWVKKRRLERERLAREKEAAELTSALDTDSRRTSTDGSSAVDSTGTDISTLAASSAPTTPPSTSDSLPPAAQDYILQAVRLSPNHKRIPSVVNTTVSQIEPANNSPSTPNESSSDEDETLKEEDSDDSEVDETEDHRKTSLGAGVEKISRHKEAVH